MAGCRVHIAQSRRRIDEARVTLGGASQSRPEMEETGDETRLLGYQGRSAIAARFVIGIARGVKKVVFDVHRCGRKNSENVKFRFEKFACQTGIFCCIRGPLGSDANESFRFKFGLGSPALNLNSTLVSNGGKNYTHGCRLLNGRFLNKV